MLSIGKQLTVEQRVSKAVYDIVNNPKYVALAGVIMIGERTVSDTVPTACTNGRDETYGRAFVDSLNDAELRFLILHEVYHKLYKHLTTWEWMYKKDAQLANVACDHVINIKISDDNTDGFAVMPSQGCRDYKYRDWDEARVFKDLCDKLKLLPEIDLLEVLEISSEDLVDRFEDFIHNKRDYLEDDLEVEDIYNDDEIE